MEALCAKNVNETIDRCFVRQVPTATAVYVSYHRRPPMYHGSPVLRSTPQEVHGSTRSPFITNGSTRDGRAQLIKQNEEIAAARARSHSADPTRTLPALLSASWLRHSASRDD